MFLVPGTKYFHSEKRKLYSSTIFPHKSHKKIKYHNLQFSIINHLGFYFIFPHKTVQIFERPTFI